MCKKCQKSLLSTRCSFYEIWISKRFHIDLTIASTAERAGKSGFIWMASSAAMFMSSSSLSNSSARMILSVAERMMQQVLTTRLQEFRKLLNDMIEMLSTTKSTLCWRIIGEGVNVLVDWWIRSMTCGRLRLERPVR